MTTNPCLVKQLADFRAGTAKIVPAGRSGQTMADGYLGRKKIWATEIEDIYLSVVNCLAGAYL